MESDNPRGDETATEEFSTAFLEFRADIQYLRRFVTRMCITFATIGTLAIAAALFIPLVMGVK